MRFRYSIYAVSLSIVFKLGLINNSSLLGMFSDVLMLSVRSLYAPVLVPLGDGICNGGRTNVHCHAHKRVNG
jgi:hypothetical protein